MSNIQNVKNYLIPASGSTRAAAARMDFTGGQSVSFNNFELDGLPFTPSGVYLDNTGNSGTLTMIIVELGLTITAAAGELLAVHYPAPPNHTAIITGGVATVIFVDYPVIPYSVKP